MCYTYKAPASKKKMVDLFSADLDAAFEFTEGVKLFGFDHPHAAIIIDKNPNIITSGYWGLIPFWAAKQDRKEFFKKANTLNAKIETVETLNSYKSNVDNRCLILAQSFIEYKHVPTTGTKVDKQPYEISLPSGDPFAMAGIYSIVNNEPTFTILTTEANTLMAEIHNSAKRMPVVMTIDEQKLWLNREKLEPYKNRSEIELKAVPITR
jgi:putative SOS response-associated peptidase YedK